jgi:hypothetical protein
MEWIADFNPEAMTPAPPAAILRVMNPELHQVLDELGMTLLAAYLIQMLHQSTARFADFRVPPGIACWTAAAIFLFGRL